MISVIKNKAISIAEILHFRIFGHEMGEEMRKFLKHLSWSFFGGITAAGIIAIVNILAGRWLGPEEYGKYGLVVAISSILIIPMLMGVDTASTYYLSRNESEAERKKYFASSLAVVLFLSFAVSVVFFLFFDRLEKVFTAGADVMNISLFFAVFLMLRGIFDSALKGMKLFKFQSTARILEALTVLIIFFVFAWFHNLLDFRSYAWAMIAGYIFLILAIIWKLRNYLGFSVAYTPRLVSYGKFAISISIYTVIFYSLDKVLINRYLGAEQLGIYNAYNAFTSLFMAQMIVNFVSVFFPYMASISDKGEALKKMNRLIKIIFIPVFLSLLGMLAVALALLGNKYKFDWVLALEFCFLGTLVMYFFMLSWLISAKGKAGIKFVSAHGLIAGMIYVTLMIAFRQSLNLYNSVLFMIIAFFYMIGIGNIKYKKLLEPH